MPRLLESELPPILLQKPETLEVINTFEHLYQRIDSSLLPSRAKIMPYTDEAESVNLRDNVPPWEETGRPPKKDFNYGEIFDRERGQFLKLDAKVYSDVVSAIGRVVFAAFEKSLPIRMRSYTDWILSDLTDILRKRLLSGRQPSLFEDLFQIYRAGYFSYGWTGEYPDDVHFLVFPARD